MRRGQRTTPRLRHRKQSPGAQGIQAGPTQSPQTRPLHSARGAFLVPACHQSLGHLLTDHTLSPASCPEPREARSMRICIFSFDYRKWSLTHELGNLPDMRGEMIQFAGPHESLPTGLPKVHPGLSNCPAPQRQGWHGRALDCHQMTAPQSHYTFLAPRAQLETNYEAVVFISPWPNCLPPSSWMKSFLTHDPWCSDLLTLWFPDPLTSRHTVQGQSPPPLCIPSTYVCIYHPSLYTEAPQKQRLYSMYKSKA